MPIIRENQKVFTIMLNEKDEVISIENNNRELPFEEAMDLLDILNDYLLEKLAENG